MSDITNVNKDQTVVNPLTKEEGGTGGFDVLTARASLDVTGSELKGAPDGVAITPLNNEYGPITQGGGTGEITVEGPTIVKTNSTTPFIITNFDIATTYLVYCDLGTVHRVGDTLYLTTSPKVGTATIVVNEQRFTVEVIRAIIDPPVITSPLQDSKNTGSRLTVTSTAFYSSEYATSHKSSSWELSTVEDFSDIRASSYVDENNKTSWAVPGMLPKTKYFVRARYHDNRGNTSDWSLAVSFTTRNTFEPMRPAIQYPVYASMDVNSAVLLEASDFETQEQGAYHLNSDWQLSTDAQFEKLAWSSMGNTLGLEQVIASGLKVSTLYYARVRYVDTNGLVSEWSNTHRFMTKSVFTADTPVIREPNNASNEHYSSLVVRSNAFHHPDAGITHDGSHWQLAHDFVFEQPVLEKVTIVSDELLLWALTGLKSAKKYYVRVRHKDSRGIYTDWSESASFETKESFLPKQPKVLFPVSGVTNAGYNTTVSSSVLDTPDVGATHFSSDWELSFDSNFATKEKFEHSGVTALVSWSLLDLTPNRPYYVRVRYTSVKDGIYYESPWSPTSNFAVSQVLPNTPSITTPSSGAVNQEYATLSITASQFNIDRDGEVHANSDWQLSMSDSFGSLVRTESASTQFKNSWMVDNLAGGQDYWVRVRFRTTRGVESNWSQPVKFGTKLSFVPTSCFVTYPPDNSRNQSVDNTTVKVSQFQGANAQDVHESTYWQVSMTPTFEHLDFESLDNASDLLELTLSALTPNTSYYVRVRQKGTLSPWTPWSAVVGFTTQERLEIVQPEPPEITYPVNEGKSYSPSPTIRASGFVAGVRGDVHKSTDWEISKDHTFATKVKAVYGSTGYKISWSVAGLEFKTVYYVRARYSGSIGGLSEWSMPVSFETTVQATGLTGIQTEDAESTVDGTSSTGTATAGEPVVKTDPTRPSITFPTAGNTEDLSQNITFTSSRFGSLSKDSHKSSSWFITDESGSRKIKESGESTSNKTAWSVNDLEAGETYCVAVSHTGAKKGASEVSDKVTFSLALNTPIARPTIVYPTSLGKIQQLVIEASTFTSTDAAVTHASSDWELFDKDNKLIYSLYDNQDNKTTLPIWQLYTLIAKDNEYLIRVRYKGPGGMTQRSAWSKKALFQTTESDVQLPPKFISPAQNFEIKARPMITVVVDGFKTTSKTVKFVGIEFELSSSSSFTPDTTVTHTYSANTYLDGVGVKTVDLPNPTYAGNLFIRAKMFGSDGVEPEWSEVLSGKIVSGMRPVREMVRMPATNQPNSSDYFGFSIGLDNDGSILSIGDPGSRSFNPQPTLSSGDSTDMWTQRGEMYFVKRLGGNWVVRDNAGQQSGNFEKGVSTKTLPAINNSVWWGNYTLGKNVCSGTSAIIGTMVPHGEPLAMGLLFGYTGGTTEELKATAAIQMIVATFNGAFKKKGGLYNKFFGIYESSRLDNKSLSLGTRSTETNFLESSKPNGGGASAISRNDTTYAVAEPVLNSVGIVTNWMEKYPITQTESLRQQIAQRNEEYATLVETKDSVLYIKSGMTGRVYYELDGKQIPEINAKDGWVACQTGNPDSGGTSVGGGPRNYLLAEDSSFFGSSLALNAEGTIIYVGCLGTAQTSKDPSNVAGASGECGIGHVIKYEFTGTKWQRVGMVSGRGYGMDLACDASGDYFVTGGFAQAQALHQTSAPASIPQRPNAKLTQCVIGETGTMVYGKMGEELTIVPYADIADSGNDVYTGYGGSSKSKYGQSMRHGSPDVNELTGSFPYLPGMDPRYLRRLRTGGNRAFDVHFGKKVAMTDAGIPVSVGKNFIQYSDSYIPFTGMHPIRDVTVSGDGKYLAVSCGSNREDAQVIIYSL